MPVGSFIATLQGKLDMITAAQVAALFPRAAPDHQAAMAGRGPALFARLGIAGRRLHFLLAQLGHESAGLTRVEEGLNYSAARLVEVFPKRYPNLAAAAPFANNPQRLANTLYGGRLGNGPPESGDGYRFRGRGYIQITGRENYRKIGAIAGVDILANPDAAASADHALEIACAYWMSRNLNAISDTNDFEAVTRAINGKMIGIEDRRAWLDKVTRIMALPLSPATAQPSAADVVAVQRALQKLGFSGIGAADGDPGPRTMAAVMEFRHRKAMPAGGINAALLTMLGIAG